MTESTLHTDFKWFCDTWLSLKQKAEETKSKDDIDMYKFFLEEAKKDFQKVYAGMTNEKWIEFMGDVLKTITCNLKEISIKYKNYEQTNT